MSHRLTPLETEVLWSSRRDRQLPLPPLTVPEGEGEVVLLSVSPCPSAATSNVLKCAVLR